MSYQIVVRQEKAMTEISEKITTIETLLDFLETEQGAQWINENLLFFRVHGLFAGKDNIPCFCAEHAESTWNGCGPDDDCSVCDGEGCEECANTGSAYNENTTKRGYSAYIHASQLVERCGNDSSAQDVVIFSGEQVGFGGDGEALAVPDTQICIWTSMKELDDYEILLRLAGA